jgi:hypothetical protein
LTASRWWLNPVVMSMPCAMQWLYAMISDGPFQASASWNVRTVCTGFAPIATCATYTLPYAIAIMPRSFLPIDLPAAANFATAPRWVDFEACPPVLL